jgi:hypothetical protein
MASHEPFGHLQPQLWAKEGQESNCQESTYSRCPILECDMALESSRGELQLWFRPRVDQTIGSYELPNAEDSNPGQFRDSNLGIPGKRAIWM